jgi:O-antigen/teichoic acid export membrane protein
MARPKTAGPLNDPVLRGLLALAVGALFLVVAMLTSPLGLATARERLRFWLDAATVMVAVAIFAWPAGGVRPTAHAGGSTLATALASTLLVPAAILVAMYARKRGNCGPRHERCPDGLCTYPSID